ncbi:serine/threonine-protein kinase [Streptomyces murinus]|uniref:Serine/threonine protein kinase n=1 Tax=Streptomyces murinus TaxID=33900 RepID=A0A7W3NTB2_STRMR|nr:serine/threonine-protein kinase [Streptomyces murinus]MBA9056001.1 serine/threonine protein kinase [Streptomyces murinus]UWW90523.1 protein kinase [Streptomyces murinus]
MYELNEEKDPAVLGPFELLAVLGQGGMGRTYLGRRLPLENLGPELETGYHLTEFTESAQPALAAVKVIKPSKLRDSSEHSEEEARARFAQEIETMRTVASARVPALLGADADAEQPWLAMDYVNGPTLHKLVHTCGPLAVGPYGALGLALVDALRAIHGAKLLHRDLKPGNIALGPDGPVVLDFGLAVLTERDSDAALTKTGVGFGTPSYMSLEQATDTKHVTDSADIYSMGAVLFFAASKRPPYPFSPLPTAPKWDGLYAPYLPLLGRILVQVEAQRPSLDEIESDLQQLLAVHGLTEEAAADQLRVLVAESGLVPELPANALSDVPDPEVQQAAQQAVNQGGAPDSPWMPDLFDEFLEAEAEDLEPLDAPAEPTPGPAEYVPTVVDPGAQPAPGGGTPQPTVTSYYLAPPQPPVAPDPAVAPSVALRAAERLRKAYAHSGRL